ncbi:DUF3168 domain-containing protein [Hyphococcus luteus]|uniref:DUF3168 domain-containing protein n=1 Tax=Hyphococcus luteus TaxID=2058213 RepID=A0A2S7K427_9PROT|nr:DUF3168 domain-containing protein [Marinicaulis flavus]PQA87241.1 DUF3168 domain-containing protein [Marinicaulis flavus]
MTNAQWELQKAVYQALRADAALKSEIGDPARIFDDPPPAALFPYLTIGEARASDYKGVDGALEHDLKLYAFSRYAGRREVKRILCAVYDALHEAALTLSGHDLVNIRFVFADAFRRLDGEIYQGVARFRAVTMAQ